ncbi:MAG: VOC family protein [Acidobacteria bacterium]|nr:VOC family protein [Acidobacteriota bacterium]
MRTAIDRLLSRLERREISRRDAVGQLAALVTACAAGVGAGRAEEAPPATFQARELNHIALRVTDLDRSVRFYERHLGLRPYRRDPSSAFLDCGPHFVALFRREDPGMDHYCYTIDGYDQAAAAARLRSEGLEPELVEGRIYFADPDGLRVQLAGRNE